MRLHGIGDGDGGKWGPWEGENSNVSDHMLTTQLVHILPPLIFACFSQIPTDRKHTYAENLMLLELRTKLEYANVSENVYTVL
jgi:hypothetical protein